MPKGGSGVATNAPEMLRDMRWAARHVHSTEETTAQRAKFRTMALEDLKGFLALKKNLEDDWERKLERASKRREERAKTGGVVQGKVEALPVAVHEDDAALMGRVDQWLVEHGVKADGD